MSHSDATNNNQPTATDSSDSQEDSTGTGVQEVDAGMNFLAQLFSRLSSQAPSTTETEEEKPEQLLSELTVQSVVDYMRSDKCKNVIVMCGAGISTSAGIPDFRSPGTGLYDNLQKYDLPSPQSIFEISYFKENPQPFYTLAKELYPGKFKPTWSHYFVRMLEEKGFLARVYTQNIDTLERVAGISDEKIVEAHGAFHTAHCVNSECTVSFTQEWVRDIIFNDQIPHCPECDALVKPDIVFFGEQLPERFFRLRFDDFDSCDLLIVMGTSLKVQPFASLVDGVSKETPRLLINREKCGESSPMMAMMGLGSGLDFDSEKAYRDVALLGDCDDGCKTLSDLLGWKEDFENLVEREHKRIDTESKSASENSKSPSNKAKSVPVEKKSADESETVTKSKDS